MEKSTVAIKLSFIFGILNGLFLFFIDLHYLRINLNPSLFAFINLILIFFVISYIIFWFRLSPRKPTGVLLFGFYLILLGYAQVLIRLTILGGIIDTPEVLMSKVLAIIFGVLGIIKLTLILGGVFLILGGVFVLRFKDWARRLSVYTSCYYFLAVALLIVIELIQRKETAIFSLITMLTNFLTFGLPIFYLTRANVKEQFN